MTDSSTLTRRQRALVSAASLRAYLKRHWRIALLGLTVGTLLLLWFDHGGPKVIRFSPCPVVGVECRIAPDLYVQGHDADGSLWAARGQWAYRLDEGSQEFVRQYRIPTGLTLYWLLSFETVRKLSGQVQAVEFLPLEDGGVVAIAAGHVWHRENKTAEFRRVKRLRYYGPGVGRGVLGSGLARLSDGRIMLGEYPNHPGARDVRVYLSSSDYRNWQVIHEFPAGEVRHVHAVQQDPFTGRIWVFTGDADSECVVLTMMPDGSDKTIVGQGAQRWRVVQAVFAEKAVFWGADTEGPDSGIWRFDRPSGQLTRVASIEAEFFYSKSLVDGTMVFAQAATSPDRSRLAGKAKLWVLREGEDPRYIFLAGRLDRSAAGRPAIPRLPRTSGADKIYVSMLHAEGLHGDLLVIEHSDRMKTN